MNELISDATALAVEYGAYKDWLVGIIRLSEDALHIHTGLGLYLFALLLLRAPFGAAPPWLTVFALTLLGEAADYLVMIEGEDFDLLHHLRDILNTMLWPTVLTLWGRWRRRSRS